MSAFMLPHERRAADRLPTTLRAKLFPGALDCLIVDFSKRGARLRFSAPPEIDERMVLVVWSSGLAFELEHRWSVGDEIGVQFVASRDLRRPAPPRLAAIQALWRKRRPRVGRRQLVKQAVIIENRRLGRRHLGWTRARSPSSA
jgi:hypothetical protein